MFLHFKLQHILFVAFTLIASFPVIVLAYWEQRVALENEVNAVKDKHLLVAKNVTRDLSRYVTDVENSFNLVIHNAEEHNVISGITSYLKSLNIRYIYITDYNGNIISKIPASENTNNKITAKRWTELHTTIEKARKSEKIIYSNLIRTGTEQTTFFLVKNLNHKQLAIAALSTTYIKESQKQISFGRRGHVAIVDTTGRAIAHPIKDWVTTMKDMSFLPPVKKMMHRQTGVSKFYTPAMKADMVAGYTFVERTGWGVMVPQPFEELEERARRNQNTAYIIMVCGITVAGLISWFLSILLSGPIQSVVNSTKFIEDKDHKLEITKEVKNSYHFIPKEIKELIDSFNNMRNKLNSLSKQLYSKIDLSDHEINNQNIKLKDQTQELININKKLEMLSTTDTLTQLFNRRLFDGMLESEYAHSKRHNEKLSLVMMDIDHFKAINDEYGHSQGDKVLADVAKIIKQNIRSSDVAFRIGGEEFAILCRRTNYDESKVMIENLRKHLEQHEFHAKDKIINVTASFGIVIVPNNDVDIDNSESFYRYADKAMYFSKHHGRNQVTNYQDIKVHT